MNRFYNDTITELFLNPRHAGEINHPLVKVQVGHPGLSDVIQLTVTIKNNQIDEIKFKAAGRLTTIAAAEYICQQLQGHAVNALPNIMLQDIIEGLQLPNIRLSSAVLAEEAAKNLAAQIANSIKID
jgi:nitrogen fixation NifU-like protein